MLIKEDDTRLLKKALISDHLISRVQEEMVFEVESDVMNKNGVEFVSIKAEIVDGDETLFGKMLFAKKKDYIVMFLFVEVDKSGKVMDQIMDSISFQ